MSAPEPPAPEFPPGYEDEYIGYITRNVAIAFIVLEVFFVSLRYVAQRIGRKSFGIDDWLMLPGLVLCLGVDISALIGLRLGRIGYHIAVVAEKDPQALKPWAQVLVVTPILYSAACWMPKLVILTLYLRIFNEKPYRIACYTMIGIITALAVADIIAGATICTPIAFLWDKTIKGGHCINIVQYYRWGTLPNAVTDLFMLILPLPVVWKLHTTKRVKIGLTLTFLTGSVGMITSILRCVAFFVNNPLVDGTWISVTFLNWSIIEPGVYLIAACLPCYRPLLNYLLTGDPKTSQRSHNRTISRLPNSVKRVLRSRDQAMGLDSLDTARGTYSMEDTNHLNMKQHKSNEESLVRVSRPDSEGETAL